MDGKGEGSAFDDLLLEPADETCGHNWDTVCLNCRMPLDAWAGEQCPSTPSEPVFPVRFFPARSGGREVESMDALLAAARENGPGWAEDAEGYPWDISAAYTVSRERQSDHDGALIPSRTAALDDRGYAERLKALHDELLTAVLGPHWSGRSTSHALALARVGAASQVDVLAALHEIVLDAERNTAYVLVGGSSKHAALTALVNGIDTL